MLSNMELLKQKIESDINHKQREIKIIESKTIGQTDIYSFVDLKNAYSEIKTLRETIEYINEFIFNESLK